MPRPFWTEKRINDLILQARMLPLSELSREWKRPKKEIFKVLRQHEAVIIIHTYVWKKHTVKVYAQGCSAREAWKMTSSW